MKIEFFNSTRKPGENTLKCLIQSDRMKAREEQGMSKYCDVIPGAQAYKHAKDPDAIIQKLSMNFVEEPSYRSQSELLALRKAKLLA
jgi:hypothetical protein